MRIPIAAGNWKLNYGPREAATFIDQVRSDLTAIAGVEILVFPSFISIPIVCQHVAGTTIQVGSQNVSDQVKGAFTGEVSAAMVAELCQWTIIGHSERRNLYEETDSTVQRKTLLSLESGLKPIVCLGEHLSDYELRRTEHVIVGQVHGSLSGLPLEKFSDVVVAYEPIWAIGTGKAASRADAEHVARIIRREIAGIYGVHAAESLRILYGGSVTSANIAEFMASPDIDGALIGGASLKREFVDIARIIAHND